MLAPGALPNRLRRHGEASVGGFPVTSLALLPPAPEWPWAGLLLGGLTLAVLGLFGRRLWRAQRRARSAPPDERPAPPPFTDGPGPGERVREVEHRLQNVLATVTAVLDQSRRSRPDPAEALRDFERRLRDLRRLHGCLGEAERAARPVALEELVRQAVGPYTSAAGGEERLIVSGPAVLVPEGAVLPLGTALCELATNAVKYGALSGPSGKVYVTWDVRPEQGRPADEVLLAFEWRELGGPTVVPPTQRGYGTRLLERGVTGALGGEAQLDFEPEGLACWMLLPFAIAGARAGEGESGGEPLPALPRVTPQQVPR